MALFDMPLPLGPGSQPNLQCMQTFKPFSHLPYVPFHHSKDDFSRVADEHRGHIQKASFRLLSKPRLIGINLERGQPHQIISKGRDEAIGAIGVEF